MAKRRRQYSQKYIDEQYSSMNNPVMSKQEYEGYVAQVKKANNKLMRGMREGKVVSVNLYSTAIGGIKTRDEFEKRQERVNATLQRDNFKKRNDKQKQQILTNIDKYIGDMPNYDKLRKVFEQLSAMEIEEYMAQASEVNFDQYYTIDDSEIDDYFEGQEFGIINSLDRFLQKKLRTWEDIDEELERYDEYIEGYTREQKGIKALKQGIGPLPDEIEDVFEKATMSMLKQRKSVIQRYSYLSTQLNELQVEWDL